MHELSIATSLVELACEKAAALGEVRVGALHVRLGALAGVVKDALLFSFELAAQGTLVAGARLEIEDVPVVVYCPRCSVERELQSLDGFECPVCQTPTPRLLRGRELELFALEVLEHEASHS